MLGKQIQRRQSVREQGGGWRGLGGEAEEKEEEEEVGITQSRGRRTRDVLQVESSRMD